MARLTSPMTPLVLLGEREEQTVGTVRDPPIPAAQVHAQADRYL